MRVSINVRGDAEIRAALRDLNQRAKPSLVTAINRVSRDLRTRVVRKSIEVYNISRRDLMPFVTQRRASGNNVRGSVSLRVRAIPIEFFRPRVKMQDFTYTRGGRSITQRLPSVYLKRFKNGAEKYVGPAFPLTQRRSGALRRGEKVRRRIGPERDRLTRIRYYTFPKQFTEEVLLPDAVAYIGPAISVELRRAFRRFNARTAQRALVGNRS